MTRFKDYRLVEYRKDQTSIDKRLRLLVGDGRLKGVYNYNVGFIDSEGDVQQPINTDGELRINTRNVLMDSSAPGTNANADLIIGTDATETFVITSIHGQMTAAVAVADRVMTIDWLAIGAIASGLTQSVVTDSVTLSSGQEGSIYCSGGQIYLNDNGTITEGNNAIVPMYVPGGTLVTCGATAKNAGDRLGLLATFLRVRG